MDQRLFTVIRGSRLDNIDGVSRGSNYSPGRGDHGPGGHHRRSGGHHCLGGLLSTHIDDGGMMRRGTTGTDRTPTARSGTSTSGASGTVRDLLDVRRGHMLGRG